MSPIRHLDGNILDAEALRAAVDGCTVVFHLAALTHAGKSRKEPLRYFEVNALGTAHVLQACRQAGVARFLYTSTSHVYGVPRRLPVDEEHPTAPLSVYAATKLAGETAVQGYSSSFEIASTIARLSNLYGTLPATDTVVGTALRQAASGGPIALRDLTPVRDFIHADDVVEALVRLAAAEHDEGRCRIVNVTNGCPVSIEEMARSVARVAEQEGLGAPEIVAPAPGRSEAVPRLVLDHRRLDEITGWSPPTSLEEGLRTALREIRTEE